MYIDLMKKCLIDLHRVNQNEYVPIQKKKQNWRRNLLLSINKLLIKNKYLICDVKEYNLDARINGIDWPAPIRSGLPWIHSLAAPRIAWWKCEEIW